MDDKALETLFGQTAGLMLVLREILEEMPRSQADEVRERVEARLRRHEEQLPNGHDTLAGAVEIVDRLFNRDSKGDAPRVPF